MTGAGYFLIIVGIVVIGVVVWLALRRPRSEEQAEAAGGDALTIEPPVRSVEIEDDTVVVEFAVPLPEDGEDERLQKILLSSAVEAVRRRKNLDVHLASGRVTSVVARSGRDAVRHVGRVDLTGGRLPDPASEVAFEIATGAAPLLDHAAVEHMPGATPDFGPDELPTIGSELGLRPEVATALRAQGLHPSKDDAPELVRGLLRAAGYAIETIDDETYLALRGGDSVFVRSVAHGPGEHPELAESEVDSFLFALAGSSASQGLLVTAKLIPFHLYEREHEKARLVGRQRLPGFAQSLFRH